MSDNFENHRYTKGKPEHPRALKHRLARIAGTADEKGNAPSAKSKALKAKKEKHNYKLPGFGNPMGDINKLIGSLHPKK